MFEGIKYDIAESINKVVGSISRFVNYNQKGAYLTDIFPQYGYGEKLKPGNVQSMLNSFTGWGYNCIDVRATKVASTPMKVYKPTEYEEILIKKHSFYDLIKHPNSYMSEYEFKYLAQAYLDICGSAYIYPAKNKFNRPISLEFLLPQYTNKIKRDGEIIYTYSGTEKYQEFKKDEIIHIKYPNPSNPLEGLSPMVAARMPINLVYYMEQFLLSLLANRARPDIILSTQQNIGENEARRTVMSWKKQHSGIDKAGSIAVMGHGLDVKTISLSPTDIQFLESKKQAFKEISAAYKVPIWKLGETEGVNKSSARELEHSFQRDTISPLLKIRDMYMTNDIISLYDKSLIVKSDNVIPVDIEFEHKKEMDYVKALIYSPNMVLEKHGEKPVSWGKTPYAPFNYVQISGEISKSPSIGGGAKPGKNPPKMLNYKTMSIEKRKEFRQKLLDMHLKRHDKNERLMLSKVVDFFGKQEREVLKNLRKYGKEYKQMEIYLPPQAEEDAKLLAIMTTLIKMNVIEGGESLIEDFNLGIPFDANSEFVKEAFRKRAKLIKDINNTTFKKIKTSLSEGINNGETMKELAGRIENVFGEAKGSRAMKIARTETNAALNSGHHEAMRQADRERHEWITSHDEKVRDTHEANEMDGCIPREQPFSGTGEISPGEPDCRCSEIPCLEDF